MISSGIEAAGQVFQGVTYEELARPVLQVARAHSELMSAINSLSDYVVDVLGHNIDAQLRQDMNEELDNLTDLRKQLSTFGFQTALVTAYNSVYKDIQVEIADYNNRIAKIREQGEKEKAEPSNWSGSGFALNDGYIATNFHVVERAKDISVYGINGDLSIGYAARVIGVDRVNDLAIIKISDSRFSGFSQIPYAINNQISDVGESVWVLGYPMTQLLGNEIKLTTGVVSSRSGFQGDVSTYQISAPVQPGNSGGPLFDSRGDIVGIVNAGVPGAENVGYAIKTLYLKNLVDSYSLSSSLPNSNSISSLALKDQVKKVKDFVLFIVCTSESKQGPSSSVQSNQSSVAEATGATASSRTTITTWSKDPQMVDLGLSIKWADRNIGASSPFDYGSYYAWGETGFKNAYGWESYQLLKNRDRIKNHKNKNLQQNLNEEIIKNLRFGKYNTQRVFGSVDNKTRLEETDDVAHIKWGKNWRMPTMAEWEELLSQCRWEWTIINSVWGYKVIGPNGNSIFLPASGLRDLVRNSQRGKDTAGNYWSSALKADAPYLAYGLQFSPRNRNSSYGERCLGLSIRPVSE